MMNNLSKKVAIYGISALIGLTSLFGGFKYEPNTQQIQNPTQVEQVVKGSKLENIVKSVKFGPTAAYAMEKGVFQAPSLEGYTHQKTWDDDWNENGTKETTTKLYQNSVQDKIIILYKKGTDKIWGVGLDKNGDNDTDISSNYLLVDTEGNGIFNQRYNLKENVIPPGWVE